MDSGCILVSRVFEQKGTKGTKNLGFVSAVFSNRPLLEQIMPIQLEGRMG